VKIEWGSWKSAFGRRTLGGGFARGLAHIGVLSVLEQDHIPVRCMRMPLGVVATDVVTGECVTFRDRGDVVLPIRASCWYPGLFQPVRCGDRLLVDGAISTEVPALLARLPAHARRGGHAHEHVPCDLM
jgi:NTE family protein